MSLDNYNATLFKRCQNYIKSNIQEWSSRAPRTMDFSFLIGIPEHQLVWNRYSGLTYNWCSEYIRRHRHAACWWRRSGGRNSVKRQSKRKQNRGKKSKSGGAEANGDCEHEYSYVVCHHGHAYDSCRDCPYKVRLPSYDSDC